MYFRAGNKYLSYEECTSKPTWVEDQTYNWALKSTKLLYRLQDRIMQTRKKCDQIFLVTSCNNCFPAGKVFEHTQALFINGNQHEHEKHSSNHV